MNFPNKLQCAFASALLVAACAKTTTQTKPSASDDEPRAGDAPDADALKTEELDSNAEAATEPGNAPPSLADEVRMPSAPAVGSGAGSPVKQKSGKARTAIRPAENALSQEMASFRQALEPTRLSCEGALPHLEAICEISRRLCESLADEPASPKADRDCLSAKKSCARARSQYEDKCSS